MQTAVTFLGTGHGNVSAERYQASIMLETAGQCFLLDAGEPCAQRLRALGVRPGALQAVLLTHGHADHIGGLGLLFQAAWGDGRETPLPVYAPKDLVDYLGSMLSLTLDLLPARRGFHAELIPLIASQASAVGNVTVVPHPTTHFHPALHRESFAFDLTTPDKRIVYSGDIGHPSDLAPLLATPCDLLICELSHISPDDLEAALSTAQATTLVLTHVADIYASRIEEIRIRLEENLPGIDLVFTAEDDQRITV